MAYKNKILVVEDEIAIASLYKMALSNPAYEFLEPVITGEKSIEVVKAKKPHLIIMDICLAGKVDGIDAAKEILKINEKIKIIFVTGYGDEATEKRVKELGDYPMYSKPISIAKLRQVIEQMLAG